MLTYSPLAKSVHPSDPDLSEPTHYPLVLSDPLSPSIHHLAHRQQWLIFAVAVFLVSVPVFIQAPMVRSLPWLSLLVTPGLIWGAQRLLTRPETTLWGDLLIGFAWTWLAGSVYWGWFRWEPYVHLPIEAIGLPFALWGIARGWLKLGHFFYLGSLLGTAVTDVYFYLVNLIPYWRKLMQVEADAVQPIFQAAITRIQTPWGMGWAIILAVLLLLCTFLPLSSRSLHWWAFGGAVFSTILVDGLFWLAAHLA